METKYLLVVKSEGKDKKILVLIQKLMSLTQDHRILSLKTNCFTHKNYTLFKGFVMFESLEQMEAFANDI